VLAITPAFNEGQILPEFLRQFSLLRESLNSKEIDLKLLVVNDGSTDQTQTILEVQNQKNLEWLTYISFSSNFGHQAALAAGLSSIDDWPEAVITLDCDLEHPLEVIYELVEVWSKNKFVLVNTVRRESQDLPFLKRLLSKAFYFITAHLTGLDLKSGQADFRLWDAKLCRALKSYFDHIGSLRVFAAWLPGKKGEIYYDQHVTANRKSRFTFKKNWQLAILSIVRFSTTPLRLMNLGGLLGILISSLYAIYTFIRFLNGQTVQGWSSLVFLIIFMGCLQLFSLGIIATYLQRLVFAKDLPPYLIIERSKK
jgi:glycosyltransferase involved in cell wall biosynthesis